ncbi:hypothetical protein VitviT2T_014445 [Vitis vinifera]|nr:hypothetical protein VitviT2T_014445 [Vitis vinifera]
MKVRDGEAITYETTTIALRRGAHFFSALQVSDSYWPVENSGPLYFFPPLDMRLYITGHLDIVFPEEFLKEILRYQYCHQVKNNPSGDFKSMYRHISKGSWTFSDQDHGCQVSDCTTEGLKCCLLFSRMAPKIVGMKMEPERLFDVVNILLSLQSKNGGLAAWEPVGASEWLELLNPTEFFTDIVIEHE